MPISNDITWRVQDVGCARPPDISCAVPRTQTTFGQFGDRSFASAGPRVWNSLLAHLYDELITHMFKGLSTRVAEKYGDCRRSYSRRKRQQSRPKLKRRLRQQVWTGLNSSEFYRHELKTNCFFPAELRYTNTLTELKLH